jgi:hypothetical protein
MKISGSMEGGVYDTWLQLATARFTAQLMGNTTSSKDLLVSASAFVWQRHNSALLPAC